MKIKYLAAIIASFLFLAVASAQQYAIRANRGLNLRATPSLDAAIAETVPSGSILQVLSQSGRWLKINRDGNEVWLANWVNFSRVDQPPSQTDTASASPPIDNCCYVDRQCNSDQQWTDGYWAYQNGQCAAPAQTQPSQPQQPMASGTGPIDNCCFAGWVCQSDQQWTDGYSAYQNNQCGAGQGSAGQSGSADSCCHLGWNCAYDFDFIMGKWWVNDVGSNLCGSPKQAMSHGLILEGSEAFIAQMTAALNHLQRTAPDWYIYSITAAQKIRESLIGSGTLERSFNLDPLFIDVSIPYMAAIIVHESCHIQRNLHVAPHRGPIDDYEEEAVCDTVAISSLQAIGPGTDYGRFRIDDYYNRGGSAAIVARDSHQEWERAQHLLATLN